METFNITIHTDDGNKINYEIVALTPDQAIDTLWDMRKDNWIKIDTNLTLTEYVSANRIVKVDVQTQQETAEVKTVRVQDRW